MFEPCGLQIAKNLGRVFFRASLRRFQFNHKLVFDEQVRIVFTNRSSILVEHTNRILLLDLESCFAEPMRQGILIDFLEMAMSVVDMDIVAGLASDIAELVNCSVTHTRLSQNPSAFVFFAFFCG